MEPKEQMEVISTQLDVALEYGLEVEAIYYALKYMKENPTVTPAEAFILGVTEFIK
jgi:predicted RNA methylase